MTNENTATESSPDAAVDSPSIDSPMTDVSPDNQSANIDDATRSISTIDADSSAETLKTETGEGAEKEEGLSKEEIARFDKHPRFKEIIGQRDTARTELTTMQSEINFLKNQVAANISEPEPKPRPYKDITQLTEEEIIEWQEDKPVEFAKNLYQQVLYEAKATLAEDNKNQKKQASFDTTWQEFGEKHSDFNGMWDSGKLTQFIDNNPGHNALSAYHAMKAEDMANGNQQSIDEAVAKAVATKESEMLKNFKAKKNATVLGGGPSGSAPKENELTNTRSKGGLISAIASRLTASRGG